MPKIKKVKMKKSEIKKDKFVDTTFQIIDDMKDNWRKYFIILSVLVLIVIGIGYFSNNMKNKSREAALVMSQANETMFSGNYEAAIDLYSEIKTTYYGTGTAKKADYYIGYAYLNLGNNDEAIKSYNTFLKSRLDNDMLVAGTYIGLGYAYEAKQMPDSALYYYTEMTRLFPKSYYMPEALMNIARVYEVQMDINNAAKTYDKVIYEYAQSGFAAQAKQYRDMLEGAVEVLAQMAKEKGSIPKAVEPK